jgi:hypothetical protein
MKQLHSERKVEKSKAIVKTVPRIWREEQEHRRLDIYSDLLRQTGQSNVFLRTKET